MQEPYRCIQARHDPTRHADWQKDPAVVTFVPPRQSPQPSGEGLRKQGTLAGSGAAALAPKAILGVN